jgi:hypothetical protein
MAAFMGAPGTTQANGLPTDDAMYKMMSSGDPNSLVGTPSQTTIPSGPSQQLDASNDDVGLMAAHGGKVPALVSPGERYLPPKEVKKVAKEGKDPIKAGEKISAARRTVTLTILFLRLSKKVE